MACFTNCFGKANIVLCVIFPLLIHQDILIFVFVGRQKNIASPKTII